MPRLPPLDPGAPATAHSPPPDSGGGREGGLTPALFVLLALLALPACGRTYASGRTNVSQDPVGFTPPANYPEISWTSSLDEARQRAADEHKPMILFVRAAWSQPSVIMDTTIWHDARVLAEAGRFVAARVDLTSNYGAPIPDFLKEYDVKTVPMTVIISSEGKMRGRFPLGKARPADVAAAMRDAK